MENPRASGTGEGLTCVSIMWRSGVCQKSNWTAVERLDLCCIKGSDPVFSDGGTQHQQILIDAKLKTGKRGKKQS